MSLKKGEYAPFVEFDQKMSAKLKPQLEEWFASMRGKNVLDIGCGSGDVGALLRGRMDVYGVDEQSLALKAAQTKGIKTKLSSIEKNLPYPSSFFDNVICKDVFEHLVHPHDLLREIHRVLKGGGKLYAHVPNQFTLLDRIQIFGGRSMVVKRWFEGSEEWNFPHLRFFTHSGFREFLESNGFEVEKEYSNIWSYSIGGGMNTRSLSGLSPGLFSPGFTFTCRKK
jgi:SAM-dependent methyltransferase